MSGPAFSLNSKLKQEFTFKDLDEIKDHPMASKFVLSLNDILDTKGFDIKTVKSKNYNLSDFESEKL